MSYTLEAEKFQRRVGCELYSCRFSNRSGWALLILDEETGAVTIQSDYGDWSFIWPPAAHGRKSLKHFLCEGDFHYLAGKFMGRADIDVFDFDATISEMKREIAEDRRARAIEKQEARDLFDELDRMDDESSEDLFYTNLDRTVSDHFSGEPFLLFQHKKKPEYLWLLHGILPALIGELRKLLPEAPVASA